MESTSALIPHHRRLRTYRVRGFTLVEMLVVLSIMVLITAVVLSSHAAFDRTLSVTDTAYTVALSIRQAQTYGLSSRTFGSISNAAYGIHFDSSTPKSYLLFGDVYPVAPGSSSAYCPGHAAASGNPDAKPGNCTYDSAQNELVQAYTLNGGFTISNICGHDPAQGGAQVCSSGGTITGLDVLFLRPNTDSVVVGLKGTGNVSLSDAQIQLSAPQGGSRYICVTRVGEISVASTTCP